MCHKVVIIENNPSCLEATTPDGFTKFGRNLSSLIVDVLQMSREQNNMVRLGYTIDSFYGDKGEWTKGVQIMARDGWFWRKIILSFPNDPLLKYKLLLELHDSGL
jgi:hypothetical protein